MQENTEDRINSTSCFQINDDFSDMLLSATVNGVARKQALRLLSQKKWASTTVVKYRSAGKLLIVDQIRQHVDQERAIAIANAFADDGFNSTVLISGIEPDSRDQLSRQLSTERLTVVAGNLELLNGYLGQFTARLKGPGGMINLAQLGPAAKEYFDLVLDLGTPAFLQQQILPPGYYAPGDDKEYLRSAIHEIPHMTGEFGKPVYVKYRANICTHGSKGITGCTRCLDSCPALAIHSIGEKIEVNTSLCQGCGSCTVTCPTGALSYTWPTVQEWLIMIRDILAAYRNAGGSHPVLLVYDDKGASTLQKHVGTLPDNLIPVPVEEIGSVGMDAWLSALAYGAGSIVLLIGNGTPQSILAGIQTQFSVTHNLLKGMGYAEDRLRYIEVNEENTFFLANNADRPCNEIPAAGFNPIEKHRTIRFALNHLYQHALDPHEATLLPEGASFGEIQVDQGTCTLCMSCVGICPVKALSHDINQQQLSFLESNCVQCGLCRNVCPEDSITLVSRYIYNESQAGKLRVINKDELFRCISCGKHFISKRMLERITEKLATAGNWKIDKNITPDWLQMCGDCRIKDPSGDQ